MEKKKLERIIRIIREEMGAAAVTPTNSTGPNVAEFSPVMGKVQKRKKYIKMPAGSRKRWMKDK
tara:strand:- start:387 stop:578 length:192 start_codon:yes stop_codon:yes gene_type:complete